MSVGCERNIIFEQKFVGSMDNITALVRISDNIFFPRRAFNVSTDMKVQRVSPRISCLPKISKLDALHRLNLRRGCAKNDGMSSRFKSSILNSVG
mmetsp:Transcript_35666/g.82972  ORF Transcript_35666/g.82972 Transcript_35666/m.82972 type:complete len:95 (-) Transcript_35666:302-586(-)